MKINHSSYGLDSNVEIDILHCCDSEHENRSEDVLGYDCDGNEIKEFRILRFPFSADIEEWEDEPNVDSRLYCLVKSSCGVVFAISVYDDWQCIKKRQKLSVMDDIPVLIKSVSDMSYYEVAFSGITGEEWYYDRNRDELRKLLNDILKQQKGFVKKKVKE